MQPVIRKTREEDFAMIVQIEAEAFPNPWPEDAFTDFLFPWAWTLEVEGEIAGYIFYQGVGEEMVIINFAIRPRFQRQGWGDRLLKDSLQIMIDNGVKYIYLDVRSSNVIAQMLYRKHGFMPMGTRKNYYSLPEEDAIVMGKLL